MTRFLFAAVLILSASALSATAQAASAGSSDTVSVKTMSEEEFEHAKKLEKMHDESEVKKWITLAIAFTIGLSVLGGAIGQGVAGAGALAGVARNPGAKDNIQPLLILVLALVESLVIYALVIAILLYTKLG